MRRRWAGVAAGEKIRRSAIAIVDGLALCAFPIRSHCVPFRLAAC